MQTNTIPVAPTEAPKTTLASNSNVRGYGHKVAQTKDLLSPPMGGLKRISVFILLLLMVTACAGQKKREVLVLDERDASSYYTRIYTRAALLPTDKKHPDASDLVMFLLNQDAQGILLLTSSRSIAAVPQVTLSIEGQSLLLPPPEKLSHNTRERFRYGLFYPVSRADLHKMSSAKEVILTLERNTAYQSAITDSVKDRLSLLLVKGDYLAHSKQWTSSPVKLTANVGAWLKEMAFEKFDEAFFGSEGIDASRINVPKPIMVSPPVFNGY